MDLQKTTLLEKRRRRRRKAISIIITILFIILLLFAIAAGIWAVVTALGQERLRSKASADSPRLVSEETNLDISAILEQEDDAVMQQTQWEEGWVRHDGKVYEYNEDILTFLIMGIDKEGTVKESKDAVSGGQADALFLVVANPDDKSIRIIAVNRDTMTDVQMYGYGGTNQTVKAQIAAQHGFGDGMEKSCELTRDAVSRLFYDLPIHGYAAVNMGAVSRLNDSVGGVTITVPEDMTKVRKTWNEGAEITLTGKDAYTYVRWRDTDVFESSRSRLARQKQYLGAFVKQAKAAVKEDITLPITLYSELSKYMVTDITAEEAAYLAGRLLSYEFKSDAVYTLEGTTRMGEKHEEFYPDADALKDLMIQVFYREVKLPEAGDERL